MDPLSALSIAAAIIQFVDFGYKVAKRLQEYENAGTGDIPAALGNISTQLPLLLNALERVKSNLDDKKFDVDTKCIVRGVVVGCMGQITKMEKIMDKVLPQGQDSSFALKAKRAFVSLQSDDKLLAIEKNLQAYVSVLILHHVIEDSVAVSVSIEEDTYFEVHMARASPYYERDNLIKQIDTHLQDVIRSQTDKPRYLLLHGPQSVGKTQLALDYCHRAHSLGQFKTIFWLDGSSTDTLSASIESIAAVVRRTRQGSKEENIHFVHSFLEKRWHPWLFVLQSYDDHESLESHMNLLPGRGCGAVIVTSTQPNKLNLDKAIPIPKYLTTEDREKLSSQLSRAIESEDDDRACSLLTAGADPNGDTIDGWPVLYRACLKGLEYTIRVLLDKGADIRRSSHAQTTGYGTAIYWAAGSRRKARVSIVKMLLDHEEMLDKPAYDAPFGAAAGEGTVEIMELLLQSRSIDLAARDSNCCTPLDNAAHGGHEAAVKLLLSHNASLNGDGGITSINRAARRHHTNVVSLICEHSRALYGRLPLGIEPALQHAAASHDRDNGCPELVKYLLKQGVSPDPPLGQVGAFYRAVTEGSMEIAESLLEHGATPWIGIDDNASPLHGAIRYNKEDMLPLFLEHKGSDSEIKESYLTSGLRAAAELGARNFVLPLLEAGADINSFNNRGWTPLHLVIYRHDLATARLLLRHGARQDLADENGRTLLLFAAEEGQDILVRNMLRQKWDANVTDREGNTALCKAAARGHEKVVKELLEYGADKSLTNRYGDEPLDLAEEKGHAKVIELLQ